MIPTRTNGVGPSQPSAWHVGADIGASVEAKHPRLPKKSLIAGLGELPSQQADAKFSDVPSIHQVMRHTASSAGPTEGRSGSVVQDEDQRHGTCSVRATFDHNSPRRPREEYGFETVKSTLEGSASYRSLP